MTKLNNADEPANEIQDEPLRNGCLSDIRSCLYDILNNIESNNDSLHNVSDNFNELVLGGPSEVSNEVTENQIKPQSVLDTINLINCRLSDQENLINGLKEFLI